MTDAKRDNLKPCKPIKRLLGRVLLDGKFLSSEDLDLALSEQNRTNEILGQVLLRLGILDPVDLRAALSAQGELASLEDAVRAAAGVRQLLGNLLVQSKRLTHTQLDLALEEQRKTGEKLGEVLLRRGLLTAKELDIVLSFQDYQGDVTKSSVAFRLGEILTAAGYITREQLEDTLAKQKQSKKKLGEALVEAGYVDLSHVEHGLKLQGMLVNAVLIAALSFSSVQDIQSAGSAPAHSASAKLQVSVVVLPRASLRVLRQTPELVVTNADIARGYVEVRAASLFEVRNNSQKGFLLVFENMGVPVKEVYVQGLGSELLIGSGSGWVPQPYTRNVVTLDLSYRFVLAENAEPGTYSWPLAISVQPL